MLNSKRNLFGIRLSRKTTYSLLIAFSIQLFALSLKSQDNSPYSRYGLGDLHPGSNIYNRGMAGLSAAYSDPRVDGVNDPRGRTKFSFYPSINFSNPASYSRFYAIKEANSNKLQFGRMLLDVGVNLTSRTLHEANNPQSFDASNAYFSYLQVGVPLRKNLGLVLGLRPLSNISYKIFRNERLDVDSVQTQFLGDGGSYLFNTGAGFAIKNFSIGINAGYLFGKKDYSTRRTFINDTLAYSASNHQTKTVFGGIFFNGGVQYRVDLSKDKMKYLQLGAFGNMRHGLSTRSDIIRETYILDPNDNAQLRLDSVSEQLEVKGKLTYPSTFGVGFIVEQLPTVDRQGWLFGADYISNNWDDYRFNGQKELAVRSNWELKIGGQLRPKLPVQRTYRRVLAYRAGVFFGDDYIFLNNQKLSMWGITAGLSLPIANLKDPGADYRPQFSIVNISLEYIKRGKTSNPIYENQFRFSVGFTLSDRWFHKRKYD